MDDRLDAQLFGYVHFAARGGGKTAFGEKMHAFAEKYAEIYTEIEERERMALWNDITARLGLSSDEFSEALGKVMLQNADLTTLIRNTPIPPEVMESKRKIVDEIAKTLEDS